ncbi:MAG: MFS transporter [Gemmataceae bacterium]|nr:MFS transporter [Gemmataceae bacterium]
MHDPAPLSAAPPAPAEAPAAPRSNRAALLIVFLVVFIDLLGFGIVLPLLPLYATELLAPLFPGEEARVLRGVLLGLLMASFSLMQFVFAPLWGRLSDRVGRRPILLLGLAGSVAFYGLFAVAAELGAAGSAGLGLALLFVARMGAGVAGATIPTAQAVIADSTPPEKRAHGMALIGAAFGIGFTFGPLLGFAALFVDLPSAPGIAAALLSLGALLLAWKRLPETLRPGAAPVGRRGWLNFRGLGEVLRMPTVGALVATFFLATFAFGSLESTLALVNKLLLTGRVEEADRTITREALQQNFLVFAYVGVVLMLVQGFLYRRLVQRVGEVRFLQLGLALMALGLGGAVGVLHSRDALRSSGLLLPVALTVMTVAVMGFAFLTPSVQALVSRRSDPTRQGEVLGVNQSAAALARILGPFLGVTLFFVTPSHEIPYLLGAALLLLVFVWSLRIRQETGV